MCKWTYTHTHINLYNALSDPLFASVGAIPKNPLSRDNYSVIFQKDQGHCPCPSLSGKQFKWEITRRTHNGTMPRTTHSSACTKIPSHHHKPSSTVLRPCGIVAESKTALPETTTLRPCTRRWHMWGQSAGGAVCVRAVRPRQIWLELHAQLCACGEHSVSVMAGESSAMTFFWPAAQMRHSVGGPKAIFAQICVAFCALNVCVYVCVWGRWVKSAEGACLQNKKSLSVPSPLSSPPLFCLFPSRLLSLNISVSFPFVLSLLGGEYTT